MFRKHSDDIPELTLPKWPFILGDFLLVATAFAIAILGDWQLTDWQVFACVLAVALGAALFVLPFIVEYFARDQENSSVSDQRSTILASHIKELEARTAVMADQITRLNQVQEAAPKEPAPTGFDAAALKVIEDRLDQQAKQLKAAEQKLEKIRAAQATAPSEPEKPKPEPQKEPPPKPEPEPAVKPVSKPKPETPPRKQADTQLLKRAIHEKQDRATQAVDRIIESKTIGDKKETPKAKPEEKKLEPLPNPKAKPEPEPKAEAPKPTPEAAAPKPEVVESPKPAPTPKPKAEAKPALPAKEKPEPLVVPGESKPEPVPMEKTEPESDAPHDAKPEPEAAPTLFGSDVAPAAPAKNRAKKNETRCTVNSLIGIGNKPYLRGSGGGLNWESGLVMEFEAIGKWRWTVPADLDGPIEVQVYRNDEDPDTSGKHTLQPGEGLEINAQF